MNLTGVMTAPERARQMTKGMKEFLRPPEDESKTAKDLRHESMIEAGHLGTAPDVLLDKLSERLAFERTGVRLYEALMTKCEKAIETADLTLFREIRDDELAHFQLVQNSIKKLGGDPTMQSPCADAVGVASMGIVQLLNDPRTTVAQCLNGILTIELIDNAGWDLLIKLIQDSDLADDLPKFESAKANEERHLSNIRMLVERSTIEQQTITH